MVTIDTLKENRNEIIEFLTNELGTSYVKEGMTIIAKMVGFRGYEKYDVMAFCEAAISDNGIKDRIIMSEGAKASRWLEEHNIETSKKLMRHI